ncbi:DUF2911 domain-containing protein [Maribacter confluentis]|uniref:DUF2911 domain-containing protein n=1 Tax=Maribacter confluentis TaxID=1656093 RepID=A0ABT8RS88_9FLAO|nr:DUF2911 domain-containing protein [Maribacter confluentis]MDO1513720.1 DUF2911 domain-containing protein [Maribacter confluentis]
MKKLLLITCAIFSMQLAQGRIIEIPIDNQSMIIDNDICKIEKSKMSNFLDFFCVKNPAFQQAKSPKDSVSGKIGQASVSIHYSSPSVRGRKIWGELVPYGKVWRAGANEATLFKTDKDLTIDGKKLPAGSYSLYAIPSEGDWQVIFNSEIGQWGIKRGGETTRKVENDVLIAKTMARKTPNNIENLTYEITKDGFLLKWENLEVPISVK